MKYPGKAGPFSVGPWPQGINNVKNPIDLGKDELQDSENFVYDDDGVAETRPGLVKRVSGTSCSGLYKVSDEYGLYFDAGKLYRLNVFTWEKTELASGYSQGLKTSWVTIGPRIFFTNGREHGRIHVPSWEILEGFGTPNPGLAVTLTQLGYGSLQAGRYFVALTYVDAWGEESGANKMEFIETTAEGGINVSWTGTLPSSVNKIRVYLTEANGKRDELLRVAELPYTETSVSVTQNAFGSPLETLWLDEIPTPDLITAYNGYLFFAIGERVWSSQTMRYGLYQIDHDDIGWYPENVTVLERGWDGIWIVADKTYGYVGAGPKDFQLVDNVFNFPASKFSGRQVEGELFGFESRETKNVPYWFSSRGAVIGLPGGKVLPIMKGKAEPDLYRVGASGTVEFNGVKAVVTAVEQHKRPGDSIKLQDTFSVKIVHRGIKEG